MEEALPEQSRAIPIRIGLVSATNKNPLTPLFRFRFFDSRRFLSARASYEHEIAAVPSPDPCLERPALGISIDATPAPNATILSTAATN